MEHENLYNRILAHFTGPKFSEDVQQSKRSFFESSGALDEQSAFYELRMRQFLDWYFFTHQLREYKRTPLEAAPMVRELRLSDQDMLWIESFKHQRHSLFEFLKLKNGNVYLKDIFANQKFTVTNCPWVMGFDCEEIFEARLIPSGPNYVFMRGLCFHPAEAKKFILSEVKKYRSDRDLDPEVLMLRLMKMRYKFEQFKHVRFDMIYSNENRLGF